MIGSTLIIIRNKMVQHDSDSAVLDNRSQQMVQLLDERDLGVLTAVMSLLVALVASNPDGYWSCLPKCVHILERLTRSQDILQEYTYYGIPSPWLQVNPLSQ
jgi:AP-2 complex subunit alpha